MGVSERERLMMSLTKGPTSIVLQLSVKIEYDADNNRSKYEAILKTLVDDRIKLLTLDFRSSALEARDVY